MLRALFLQELRRSWLAHAGLFVAVFGTAALAEHVATRESPLSPDEENFLGILLFGGLLLSGLISGERCFPAAFKEGRYSFFLTFPKPREGIWLALLGGRLIGALAAIPVSLLVGPSLLYRWLVPQSWSFLIAALSVYLVYFLGSAALALAFRKEILVYLLGLPLLTGLLTLLAYNTSYGYGVFFLIAPADLQEIPQYLRGLSYSLLLLALIWTAVSLRAFCRGEIHLGQRMTRTLAEAGLASAAFLGLILIAFSSSTLADIGGTWSPEAPQEAWSPYDMESRLTSADGRFLFIRQQLRERPQFKRLAVVDLESGNTTYWLERPEIYQISWSASEPVLNVLAANGTPVNCLGIPCERTTSWYRLSPDLHVLSIREFPGTGFLRQLGNDLLLVTRQGSTGRVYRLSDRDSRFVEILSQELEGDPRAWTLEEGVAVVFPTNTTLRAWWLDPQGRIQHDGSARRRSDKPYYLVGHRILFLDEVRAEAMQRDFSPLPSRQESWELLLPDSDGPLDFSSGRLYLERSTKTGALWWRGEERETWVRITEELHLVEFGRPGFGLNPNSRVTLEFQGLDVFPDRVDVDYRTGILATIVPSKGARQLSLYDGRLGRSIPGSITFPGEEGLTSLRLTRTQGLQGTLVRFTGWDKSGRLLGSKLLEVVPGLGQVRDLSRLSPIVDSSDFSQWIYLDPEGASIWLSKTGEVWQAGPGRKSLRLNPPEAR